MAFARIKAADTLARHDCGGDERARRGASRARRGGALGARAGRRLPYRTLAPPPALAHRAGHAWEQLVLPLQSARADALLCPANLAPVAARNVVVILHDAAPLRLPGCLQRPLRRVAAPAAAADRAPRPHGDHRLAVLPERAQGIVERRGRGRLRRRRPALLARRGARAARAALRAVRRLAHRAQEPEGARARRARRSRATASSSSSPAATARSSPPRRASTG